MMMRGGMLVKAPVLRGMRVTGLKAMQTEEEKAKYIKRFTENKMLYHVLMKMPPPGQAISIKSLSSYMSNDAIEIISEKFPEGGLREFLETRKQLFTVRAVGEDKVLYVTVNALAAQMYLQKQRERRGLLNALGIGKGGITGDLRAALHAENLKKDAEKALEKAMENSVAPAAAAAADAQQQKS